MKIELDREAKEEFATFAETGRVTEDFLYQLSVLHETIIERLEKVWDILEAQRVAAKIDPYVGATGIDKWEYDHNQFLIEAEECHREPAHRSGKIPFSMFLDDDAQEKAKEEIEKLKKRQIAAEKADKIRQENEQRKRELKQLQALKEKYPDSV